MVRRVLRLIKEDYCEYLDQIKQDRLHSPATVGQDGDHSGAIKVSPAEKHRSDILRQHYYSSGSSSMYNLLGDSRVVDFDRPNLYHDILFNLIFY
jgi:hypothetical protein